MSMSVTLNMCNLHVLAVEGRSVRKPYEEAVLNTPNLEETGDPAAFVGIDILRAIRSVDPGFHVRYISAPVAAQSCETKQPVAAVTGS